MKNRSPSSFLPAPLFPWLAVGCGALGQFFLSRPSSSLSLWLGGSFYLLALVLFGFQVPDRGREAKAPPLAKGREWFLFSLILALALFLRVYRLEEIPSGLTPESGCEGWGALQILRQGWRPFYEVYHLRVWDLPVYYPLAVWFGLFGASQLSLTLFFVTLSLAAFPLIYWTFRQWAPPRTALTALFILAVMRWEILFSRNAHPVIQVPFYLFGFLAFWEYGCRKKAPWAFGVSALFFSAGFYIYEAFKACVFLVPWLAAREYRFRPGTFRNNSKAMLYAALFALALLGPWIFMVFRRGDLGHHEADSFLFPSILKDGYLGPLLRQAGTWLLSFQHRGDPWPLQNLPDHPMLDGVTGFLLGFGLVLAFKRRQAEGAFLALAGFLVMGLPALLSINPLHAARSFGTTPFIALLAAFAWESLGERMFTRTSGWGRQVPRFLGFFLLGLMAWLNFHVYFREQAGNYACWRAYSVEATEVGKRISREGDRYEYFLCPRFFGHFTVMFLGYDQRDHIHEARLLENGRLPSPNPHRGLWFALEEGQTGILRMLQDLYPGGKTEYFRDPNGHDLVYFYEVPPGGRVAQEKALKKYDGSRPGLQGSFSSSLDGKSGPSTILKNTLINFTFRDDFPAIPFPPLSARWTGYLQAPAPGLYRFLLLTTDGARMALDGKAVLTEGNQDSAAVSLSQGAHALEVSFQKTGGTEAALSLLWMKPGDSRYEVVPATAYQSRKAK